MTLLQKIQNLTWWTLDIKLKDILTSLFTLTENSVPEAPIDGNQYARQDGEWTEVSGGGGIVTLQEAFNYSIAATDSPIINADNNNLDITNLSGISLNVNNNTHISTSEIGIEIGYETEEVYCGTSATGNVNVDEVRVSLAVENKLTEKSNSIIVTPVSTTLTNTDNDIVFIINTLPTKDTPPTEVVVLADDGITINKYPFPSVTPETADDFVNDAAAAIGGIEVGKLYHTAGVVKVRLS